MEYEGQICRAPMERGSFMLPVMVGCSYNQCRFCMLFKHLRFRLLPLEQIEGELQRVQAAGGRPEKIFLGDGNAFDLETEASAGDPGPDPPVFSRVQDRQYGRHGDGNTKEIR